MSLLDWLTVLFIGLKLTGYISWRWIWVLSPFLLTIIAVSYKSYKQHKEREASVFSKVLDEIDWDKFKGEQNVFKR